MAMHIQPVQDRIECHLPFKQELEKEAFPWQELKETAQWAMREPPENHTGGENNQQAQLSAVKPRTTAQAGNQTLHSDTSMLLDQKDQTLKLQGVRGLLRETMPRVIPYSKHQAKYRMLSNT